MGKFTREEIERAFASYCELNEETSHEDGHERHWTERLSDHYTKDAVYFEHQIGTFHGQDAIRKWLTSAMTRHPGSEFVDFPVLWHLVDEENDRVVVYFQNRMSDPGDGQIFEEPNISIMQYGGNNQWCYQEDIYNPKRMHDLVARWTAARDAVAKKPSDDS